MNMKFILACVSWLVEQIKLLLSNMLPSRRYDYRLHLSCFDVHKSSFLHISPICKPPSASHAPNSELKSASSPSMIYAGHFGKRHNFNSLLCFRTYRLNCRYCPYWNCKGKRRYDNKQKCNKCFFHLFTTFPMVFFTRKVICILSHESPPTEEFHGHNLYTSQIAHWHNTKTCHFHCL